MKALPRTALLAVLLLLPLLLGSCSPYPYYGADYYGADYYGGSYSTGYYGSGGYGYYGAPYSSALYINAGGYYRCSSCGYNPCRCRSSYAYRSPRYRGGHSGHYHRDNDRHDDHDRYAPRGPRSGPRDRDNRSESRDTYTRPRSAPPNPYTLARTTRPPMQNVSSPQRSKAEASRAFSATRSSSSSSGNGRSSSSQGGSSSSESSSSSSGGNRGRSYGSGRPTRGSKRG